ncbi:ATP-dependent Clp protease adapter ClpS [Propionibacterium freudenreichii]|nr:ATP-dependent Clp protease adapter ClpS [Propionibacterium freudenreichii]
MPESAPMTAPEGGTALAERPAEDALSANPWVTVVWDDPVNLMSYVTHVFCSYFHYSRDRAERLMMQVHMEGKAVVSSGGREEMERDVNAMHGFGLWATVSRAE